MKQIKILLSSVLTLLLITGNNASYASLNFEEIKVTYKPNTGNAGRFMPKRNRLGDDLTGFGYKNILKKGNVFKGNVRILPNRNSGGRLHNNGAFRERESGFFSRGLHNNGFYLPDGAGGYAVVGPGSVGYNCKDAAGNNASNGNCIDKSTPKFGGQEGEAFNPTSKYSISDEPSFIVIPDSVTSAGFIGENGKVGIFVQDVGPEGKDGFIVQADEVGFIGTAGKIAESVCKGKVQSGYTECDEKGGLQPKGVPLKFIEGEWK